MTYVNGFWDEIVSFTRSLFHSTFKTNPYNARREKTIEDTVQAALAQINEKQYETSLIVNGISPDRIHKYGFTFEGKTVLIGAGTL